MQRKMMRFLTSIGLPDIERFDMDFSLVAMDAYNPGKVNMMIEKKTPWDYLLLDEYVSAMSTIRYPYSMRFSYPEIEITAKNFDPLFTDWYFAHYMSAPKFSYSALNESTMVIIYGDEEQKATNSPRIGEFRKLLSFINYPIAMVERVEEKQAEAAKTTTVSAPAIEEPEIPPLSSEEPADYQPVVNEPLPATIDAEPAPMNSAPIEKEAEASEAIEEDLSPEDYKSKEAMLEAGRKAIEEEVKKAQEDSESELKAEAQRNLELWKIAQENARMHRRGDYQVLNCIDELYHLPQDGNVDFVGEIFEADPRMTKKGKMMNNIGVGDEGNAISVRVFESASMNADAVAGLKIGGRVRIRGAVGDDKFAHGKTVICHYIDVLPKKELRTDPEEEKRVELHCHTKMSAMDSVGEMSDYAAVAKNMGMTALACTDHGVLQGLPSLQEAAKKTGLKPIYGAELYMVDLQQKYIINPSDTPLRNAKYCVFDTETTGLVPRFDRLVEFGGLVVQNGQVLERWNQYIDPKMPISEGSSLVNHITDDMVRGQPTEEQVLPKILKMFEGCILVAHNASFDIGFINAALERNGYPKLTNPVIDTLPISHWLFPERAYHNEGAMLKALNLNVYDEEEAHEAIYDATCLNDGWQEILIRLEKMKPGIVHRDLQDLHIDPPDESIRLTKPEEYQKQFDIFHSFVGHLRVKHTSVLIKNAQGLKDMYKIVTASEVDYLSGAPIIPRTPRTLLEKYHENLLIGTACQNGEIFELAQSEDTETLAEALKFYDYVEIQPLECYSNLLNMGEIRSREQLIEILKHIIEAAKVAGKPVVATGDVHYVNPEDKILRDVYICAKQIGGRSHPLWNRRREKMPWFENPDQHFRSTREMLDSFESWLPKDYAKEIVVKNTNMIADMIGTDVVPILSGTYPPTENLPNSETLLRDLCETNFKKRFGGNEDLSVKKVYEDMHARLETELEGIIGHGYAVTYYIAHKLIKMAGEEPEHYIVGSRGSVGSSFAATCGDITEVNPLPPFYICPECHYLEWGDALKYKSGFDLPEKKCPHCGHKLKSDGQNIPFQTFLGFDADKVPDIDLNFEDESQHKAHNYTKILLGERSVYRAGTIETVAEKTAFGYVRSYFEKRGINPDTVNAEWIACLASRAQGVKRTTGQHPGGIVTVPKQNVVTDFTAVQHPADDLHSEWLTTHYDYHSMHDELLKFDILGHVDPMAMRYYRDLTGVKIEDIPMNDPKVLSLFTSPAELHLHENFLHSITGASALPEFGTRLAQQMLSEAKPKTFNDLLIISGLSHGTDVWSGNAEELILNGTTDINGVIGCRDDIMTYLISQGVDKSLSFKIMEDVRHGHGKFKAKEAIYVPAMRAAHVPEWYINSCRKIQYLFPRGHATAYVMMAVRVAYFKLYYPLEFYAVFFSIRSDNWDIKTMIEGEDAVKAEIQRLEARLNDRAHPLTPKENNILKTDYIALEMLERGYHFEKIDLYRSQAKMFTPDHEKKALIPPFSVIDGLGVAAGATVVEARESGKKFLSKEDLLARTKLTKTNVDDLAALGSLDDLGDTNQMSLFEFF